MDLSDIVGSLKGKSILIIGSTGFLGKLLLEKVLRTQPGVKKVYLLIRDTDTESASQRLHNEVLKKEVFRVLREKYGVHFHSFISHKLTPVPGDITVENFGVKDSNLKDEMWREVHYIINSAATTNFDERYDVALLNNAIGAKHVLEFSKRCLNLQTVLHVSTAYVAGEKPGLILEKPFQMGETLNGNLSLDIEREVKLAEERLTQLRAKEATKEAETFAMKELGLTRARLYGWPNTFVFTKAMGEMLIGDLREDLPLVIIRPTIITSTYREPFPGWLEGIRTIDAMSIAYGKGKLTCFPGDPDSIIDIIPGDMVVNFIVVAIIAHANQASEFIYQVGSSSRNPAKYTIFQNNGYHYYSKNPWIGKDGKPIKVGKVKVFTTMASFSRYIQIYYLIPLKYFHNTYSNHQRKINMIMRLVELYEPYLFFKGIFDDSNTEKMRLALEKNNMEKNMFCFDPKEIDWDYYFVNIHIPGSIKYVFK